MPQANEGMRPDWTSGSRGLLRSALAAMPMTVVFGYAGERVSKTLNDVRLTRDEGSEAPGIEGTATGRESVNAELTHDATERCLPLP